MDPYTVPQMLELYAAAKPYIPMVTGALIGAAAGLSAMVMYDRHDRKRTDRVIRGFMDSLEQCMERDRDRGVLSVDGLTGKTIAFVKERGLGM